MVSDASRHTAARPGLVLVAAALACSALATGCNKYELFSLAGYEQASFQNDADVLFIIDNSPSMEEEASALGLNFQTFISQLADPAQGGTVTQTLSDAVGNFISYTDSRGSVLDYQLAITTTTVDPTNSDPLTTEPGEAGTLIGDVLARGDDDITGRFLDQLLCQATNWTEVNLQDEDPAYTCGQDALPDFISIEYLDCVCGKDAWTNHQGGGTEQPLEAGLLAMCRATPDPPQVCFHTFHGTPTTTDTGVVDDFETFGQSDIMTNQGMLRDSATTVIVVVTDEGDNSTQLLSTGNSDPSAYLDAYAQFPQTIRFVAIGPRFDQENYQASACAYGNTGKRATDIPYWSVNRLVQMANQTGGFYADITTGGDTDCAVADFATYLEQLGQLLVNLTNAFDLRSIPDPSTIRVFVNGDEIAEAAAQAATSTGTSLYSDGWTYETSLNAVMFWGAAVPDYNANVQIYYRPLEGKPRDLPF
ncbi:MAG: hypothetical protein GXP62_17580 [Oligoflexia bacterium]|nr:hypothetical protein [Oligoflexia bacterium]